MKWNELTKFGEFKFWFLFVAHIVAFTLSLSLKKSSIKLQFMLYWLLVCINADYFSLGTTDGYWRRLYVLMIFPPDFFSFLFG